MVNGAMILEGGAVRGVFTAGALDYLMERDYYLSYCIGVSAGSCNAVDYVSRQPGRTRDCVIRTDKEDGSLINFRNLLKNKSLFDMDLLFDKDPNEYHPFDFQTFFGSDICCELVATNCRTGKAAYLRDDHDPVRLMKICRASSSLPLVSPMVEIDGERYLDGGIADSIPILHSMKMGNRKNVVILTRNKGYRKTISKKSIALYQAAFRDYPELARAICLRPYHYNQVMDAIEKWEEEGRIFVVRPMERTVSRTERDPERLMEFYSHGRTQMEKSFDAMRNYLEG
ncbi:MAG: patatin family protein [Candidatus Limivivens sp.]|nr:patatin family protein [Candidatus Limivivens sp.]